MREGAPDRVVWAATPDSVCHAVARGMLATGRALVHREPCRTWLLPDGAWEALCAGWQDVVARPTMSFLEVATSLALPPGYRLDVLRLDDAPTVNTHWTYRNGAVTESRIRAMIASGVTACVRWVGCGADAVPPDGLDTGTQLVCWILWRPDGSIGLLHTLAACRGLGLAPIAVRLLCILIRRWRHRMAAASTPAEAVGYRYVDVVPPVHEVTAETDGDAAVRRPSAPATLAEAAAMLRPHCHIKVGNVASERVFSKLGFHAVNHCSWLIFTRPAPLFTARPLSAAVSREWEDVHDLINASYKQDDAFFVDQQRTSMDNLRTMAREGTFYVAYADADADADGGAGHAADVVASREDSTASSIRDHDAAPRVDAARQLLACVYLSIDGGSDEHGPPLLPAHGDSAVGRLDAGCRIGHLAMLTVAPAVKKRGVGQRMLDFAMLTAASAGCTAVEACVVSVKPWLLQWYVDNGFRVIGRAEWPAACMHQLLHRQRHPDAAALPADCDETVYFHRVWREM